MKFLLCLLVYSVSYITSMFTIAYLEELFSFLLVSLRSLGDHVFVKNVKKKKKEITQNKYFWPWNTEIDSGSEENKRSDKKYAVIWRGGNPCHTFWGYCRFEVPKGVYLSSERMRDSNGCIDFNEILYMSLFTSLFYSKIFGGKCLKRTNRKFRFSQYRFKRFWSNFVSANAE